MANLKDRKPTKTALELLVDRLRREPPPPPEPSYFDKPEPDREEERRQAARVREANLAQKEAAEAKARSAITKAFTPASLSDKIKLDQRIKAIAQEEERDTAREAREDAEELLEENQAKIQAIHDKEFNHWERFDLTKPIPEDYAKDRNQMRNEAIEALYRERFAIQDRMERCIARAEARSWQATPQITNEQRRLTHQPAPEAEPPPAWQPAEPPTTLAGWLSEMQRAAAARPQQPAAPGVDISR